jgi:hypothetical protein
MNESAFLPPDQKVRKELVNEALEDWAAFNRVLLSLNLKELYALYNTELMLLRRESFLHRTRQRIKVVISEAAEAFLLELQETRKPKGVNS